MILFFQVEKQKNGIRSCSFFLKDSPNVVYANYISSVLVLASYIHYILP